MMREMISELLPMFLKVALSTGAALLIIILGVLLTILVVRLLRVKADREHSVKLVNKGNCRSRYQVWVESGQTNLRFVVLMNDVALIPVEETIEELVKIAPEEKPAKNDKKKKRKKAGGKQAEVIKKGQAVASKAGAAASLLGTVGSVVPGGAGNGLKAQAENVRGFQAQTAKATQAPQAAQRKMDALQSSSGRLGVKTNIKVGQGENGEGSGSAAEVDGEIGEKAGFERRVKKVVSKSENGAIKVQTPDLGPGEALTLILRIGKTKRKYPTGSFSYELWSQMIAVDDKFGKGKSSVKKGLVAFPPVNGLRYFLPGFCGALVMLAAIIGVIYVVPLIWGAFA